MGTEGTYYAYRAGKLVRMADGSDAPALAQFVHKQFRALVSEADFPCVGARAAVRAESYRFSVYGEMGTPETTERLAADLTQFGIERPNLPGEFNTFVAAFNTPAPANEEHFELLVWSQLQRLHEQDTQPWDPAVSSDTTSADFEFSFAGTAYFLVGLNPTATRWSRRFAWPVLVFNGHDQFERLRENGNMERFKKTIRSRDINLQGDINPNLADFGNDSAARQYSGRQVEPDWTCPFHANPNGGNPHEARSAA
jgi:FPC/CPF motif-containing protein YcgG